MATFGQIQDNIASNINRAGLTSDIQRAIRNAIKHYETEAFWFSDSNTSLVTASGTQSYTLSVTDGYSAIHQVIINSNGTRYELKQKSVAEINRLNSSGTTGEPSRYAEQNGLLVFYPIPNATFTVSINYATKFATLSATSDSNGFTVHAEDLIEARAEWYLKLRKVRDFQGAEAAKISENDALVRVRAENDKKSSVESIKPTTW